MSQVLPHCREPNPSNNLTEVPTEVLVISRQQMRGPRLDRCQQNRDILRRQTNVNWKGRVGLRLVDDLDSLHEPIQSRSLVALRKVSFRFANGKR